jgi:hypothetical protein
VHSTSHAEFVTFVRSESEKFGRVIERAKIKPDG